MILLTTFFILHVSNRDDCLQWYVLINHGGLNSWVSFDKVSTLVIVSHLVLQIHLGPTGEEKLYCIGMSTATSQHECSPASLKNRTRQNSNYHLWLSILLASLHVHAGALEWKYSMYVPKYYCINEVDYRHDGLRELKVYTSYYHEQYPVSST